MAASVACATGSQQLGLFFGILKTYIFETIQVLVALSADFALIWLLLFHAKSSGIWGMCVRINYRESSIGIIVQLLGLMAVSFVIS